MVFLKNNTQLNITTHYFVVKKTTVYPHITFCKLFEVTYCSGMYECAKHFNIYHVSGGVYSSKDDRVFATRVQWTLPLML